MALEVSSDRAVCYKCGTDYSRHKGYFPVSYALLHKGVGYLHVCKTCIDSMYNGYLAQCNDPKNAVRQVCRKLDLYWNENVYEVVSRKSTTRTMMTQYIAKINSVTYAGKSYDDTLSEEGTLWSFTNNLLVQPETVDESIVADSNEDFTYTVTEEVALFWGTGLSQKDYYELEQRRKYWMSRYPNGGKNIDIGTEALIRQICNLEIDINKQRSEGKPIDKSVNMLNTVLGSLNLKPTQRVDESDAAIKESTPFGVGISWCEKYRPIKEPDDDFKDVDGIRKYILVWFVGHLSHMLGIKNKYSRLYDEEIARLRVERPELADEDDVDFVYDIFSKQNDESGT